MTSKVIFSGFGGQGVLMMGYLLALAGMREGKEVTYLPSYGAEVRGGTANCTVIVSDEEIFSPVVSFPDFGIIMNKPSLAKYEQMIHPGGTIFLNSSLINTLPSRDDIRTIKVPVNDMAMELGSDRTINMIMIGAFVAHSKITSMESILNGVAEIFQSKKEAVIQLNQQGLERGGPLHYGRPVREEALSEV